MYLYCIYSYTSIQREGKIEILKHNYQVALNSWLKENFQSVASMFEDRYDLWILKPLILSADNSRDSTSKNKQKDSFRDSARNTMTHPRKQSELIVIEQSKLPVKRIKELRALTGWYQLFPFDIARNCNS